jgi:hypothetical protein
VFNAVIAGLMSDGEKVFSQIPYEFGLRRLAHAWEAAGNTGYCIPILTEVYGPVFESGLIIQARFIPRWLSSFGTCWERKKLSYEGVVIEDLALPDIRRFMNRMYHPDHVQRIMDLLSSPA